MATHLPAEWLQIALEVAQAIRPESERAYAIAGLAAYLPDKFLGDALAMMLEIENEFFRAEGLARLASHLPEHLLRKALEETRNLDAYYREVALAHLVHDPEHFSVTSLAGLLGRLAELGYAEEALIETQTIKDELNQAWAMALVSLTTLMPTSVFLELFTMTRALKSNENRYRVLKRLAPRLAEVGRYREALEAVRLIDMEWMRSTILALLAPYLPDELRRVAVQRALVEARFCWHDDTQSEQLHWLVREFTESGYVVEALAAAWVLESDGRSRILERLSARLVGLSPSDLYPLWQMVLQHLCTLRRPEMLNKFGSLARVVAALGGEEAVAETFRAIHDVGRWWP